MRPTGAAGAVAARSDSAESKPERPERRALHRLGLTALGGVYGDIGTSPLYAFRECFSGTHAFRATPENVMGVLSLVFWSLMIVISVKYLILVMRADNRGEGGILALLALLNPWRQPLRRGAWILSILGLFGASLLYGDGVITPAISVLSAVEGLEVATPAFRHFVIPATILILLLLFRFQSRGTSRVGAVFGPVMVVWFVVLAGLGVAGIAREPAVLAAVNPLHALGFFLRHGWTGFLVLGSVFLVVTGGEALYADMGHFGPAPIRLAWFAFVLPALLLNYFGQGALVLAHPEATAQPFYHLAPAWALYPLVALATAATVIASQAVISGAFSLTRQAVQLGQCPRVRIVQTSSEEIGQIYVPTVNWLLMIATVALVLGFRSSSNLAAAYGVAVTTTMAITTLLLFFVMRERWGWSAGTAGLVAALFLLADLSFFGANMLKVAAGGWFPLVAGVAVFTVMATWRRGRGILADRLAQRVEPLEEFLGRIAEKPPIRVPGTAVYMTSRHWGTPPILPHQIEHLHVLHEQVVFLNVQTEDVPRVPASERLEVESLGEGFHRVLVHYGFMQSPNVPVALRGCAAFGLEVDPEATTYYLGRETLIPTGEVPGMTIWREKLFAFLARNALRATAFYHIPSKRIVELGLQVEI